MDRTEAYQILIAEMKSISNKPVEVLHGLVGKSLETESSSRSGRHYSLSIKISQKGDNTYLLEGNIHDNNSFKYELLEETLEIEK